MDNKTERRFLKISSEVEVRATEKENKRFLEGYAAVFNQRSENLGCFYEYVRPNAFNKTLQEADIRALFNHNADKILGRNKAGTLKMGTDSRGLEYKVELPNTSVGSDVWESVKRGDITQNSFGFRTIKDNWFTEDMRLDDENLIKINCRELLEVQLFDISPVTYPAYPQTSVSARDILGASDLDFDSLTAILFRKSKDFEIGEEEKLIVKRAIESLSGFLASLEPVNNHSDGEGKPKSDETDFTLRSLQLEMLKRGLSAKI
jgi:HK97 family phage prohead protease